LEERKGISQEFAENIKVVETKLNSLYSKRANGFLLFLIVDFGRSQLKTKKHPVIEEISCFHR